MNVLDSGGPLVDLHTRKLVGIVSFGPDGDCANEHIPGELIKLIIYN
jgi:secreted trypsin-like serine protease